MILQRRAWLTQQALAPCYGARAGLARIEGSAADPSAADSHVVAGGWGGPLLHANLGVALEHLVARFGGDDAVVTTDFFA